MKSRKPICSQCGHTLNPLFEDGCDRYALVDGEVYCEYCLGDYLHDWVGQDVFGVAEQLGIPVQETIREETV